MTTPNASTPFVERLGLLIESEGHSRVGGQLLGILLLSDAPLSLDELALRLAVSKASVSINARQLEQKGVAVRVSFPGDRRDHYAIAPDLPSSTLRERVESLARFRRIVAEGKDEARSAGDDVCERFEHFSEAYDAMFESMQHTLAVLQDQDAKRAAGARSRTQ